MYVKQLAGNSCGTSPPEVLPDPHPAWRSLNPAEIGTSSPGAPGNAVGGAPCPEPTESHPPWAPSWQSPPRVILPGHPPDRAHHSHPPTAPPWLMGTGRERGWEHPLALSWSISPPLSHLTVLSAEKGSFSIPAVKLISYLHWMDVLWYPLLSKLEPVVWHHLASRLELGSCINCVPALHFIDPFYKEYTDTAFYAWSPSPVTPEKSSYCTNGYFYFFSLSSLWCTFNLKRKKKNICNVSCLLLKLLWHFSFPMVL